MENNLPEINCGVDEKSFPSMGKCCQKNGKLLLDSYAVICPYCEIYPSLPCGENLKMVIVFECRFYGYGKRISG